MVRPLKALMVSSTKPDSFSVSEWIITWTSWSSATLRQLLMAAGVVPQSSCSFSAQAPALIISTSAAGRDALPLPEMPRLTGNASNDWIMRAMCQGPGVQVVAKVPCDGPVPPPSIKEGYISAIGKAGNDVGAGTDDDGDARLDVGIAGLADGADVAFLDGDVGLHDPPVVDDQRIGDDGVGRALLVGDLGLPHAVADHLAAAEFHLLAIDREILFDLDDQIRVGQPHPIAGGGPEHVGIDGTFYLYGHHRAPSAEVFPPPLRGRVRDGGAACSAA